MSEAQKYIKELLGTGRVSAVYCMSDDPDMTTSGGGVIEHRQGCAVKVDDAGELVAACPISAITLVLLQPAE